MYVDIDRDALTDESAPTRGASDARQTLCAALEPFQVRGARMTLAHAFILSAAVRGSTLHDAIAREADEDNPHATFALPRSILDLVLVALQVRRQLSHADVVIDVTGPKRHAGGPLKSQKLLANARSELPGAPMTVRQLSNKGSEAKSSPTTPSNGSSATHSASKAVVPHPSVGPLTESAEEIQRPSISSTRTSTQKAEERRR